MGFDINQIFNNTVEGFTQMQRGYPNIATKTTGLAEVLGDNYLIPDTVLGLIAGKALLVAAAVGIISLVTKSFVIVITVSLFSFLYSLSYQTKNIAEADTKHAWGAVRAVVKDAFNNTPNYAAHLGAFTRAIILSMRNCCATACESCDNLR